LNRMEDAHAGQRVLLKPRTVEVVDLEDDSALVSEARKLQLRSLLLKKKSALQSESAQERNLAELRRRALAALNVGLPPSRAEVDRSNEAAGVSESRRSGHARCTCLRRSGRCTCNEDRAWLQSKRKEVSMYIPPNMRRASGGESRPDTVTSLPKQGSDIAAEAEIDGDSPCCKQDASWLQRKRRVVVPYVPPFVKERDLDIEDDVEEADVRSTASDGSTVRRRREWDTRLEHKGEIRFNPLQMDSQIVLEDDDGLVAECVDHPLSVKGVKGLPAIQSGRYQYEVELLRDSSIMIGWSGAMTLPGVLDFQSYVYSSSGCRLHGKEESKYAKPYGKAGDVIGALIDWIEPETASGSSSIEMSFCLNGEALGPAFKVVANLADARKEAPVPLQPHICQLPKGDMLKVRLRGSEVGLPLAHPVEGYEPISAVSELDFCPLSAAIEAATSERVIMKTTPEHLQSFRLPETHIVELYDFPSDANGETLISSVACFLGLKRHLGEFLHVRITSAGDSAALAACRRPEHAEQLIEASRANGANDDFGLAECIEVEKKREKPLHFEARLLGSASAKSKQCFREWRGEKFTLEHIDRGEGVGG